MNRVPLYTFHTRHARPAAPAQTIPLRRSARAYCGRPPTRQGGRYAPGPRCNSWSAACPARDGRDTPGFSGYPSKHGGSKAARCLCRCCLSESRFQSGSGRGKGYPPGSAAAGWRRSWAPPPAMWKSGGWPVRSAGRRSAWTGFPGLSDSRAAHSRRQNRPFAVWPAVPSRFFWKYPSSKGRWWHERSGRWASRCRCPRCQTARWRRSPAAQKRGISFR